MTKDDAIEMRDHGIRAIEELNVLLNIAWDRCSEEERERIRRGVGLSLGRMVVDLLSVIYEQYPDIDHLRNRTEDV
jgi:hypothetical protein